MLGAASRARSYLAGQAWLASEYLASSEVRLLPSEGTVTRHCFEAVALLLLLLLLFLLHFAGSTHESNEKKKK